MTKNDMDTVSLDDQKPTNYALNGKIMLCSVIILFIVVFSIACFHSYVRCFFHRHHPRRRRNRRRLFSRPVHSLTNLLETTLSPNPINAKALDPSVLKLLPTFTYSAAAHNQPQPLECAVCLSEFEDEETGRVLPKCNHTFHLECIDIWFESQSNCPLCRAPVQPDTPGPKPEILGETAITIDEPPGSGQDTGEDKMGCFKCSSSMSFSPEECGRKPLMENERWSRRLGSPIQNYNTRPGSSGTQVVPLKRIWSI